MNLAKAIGVGGWLVAVVLAAAGLGGITGDDDVDPILVVVTPTPVPEVPAFQCPPGWFAELVTDEHAVAFTCLQGDWIVWLHEDSSFSHALNKRTGGTFVTNSKEVPGWPD